MQWNRATDRSVEPQAASRETSLWTVSIFARCSVRPQFDVTFPKVPCAWLSLDAMDISGELHLDLVVELYTLWRLCGGVRLGGGARGTGRGAAGLTEGKGGGIGVLSVSVSRSRVSGCQQLRRVLPRRVSLSRPTHAALLPEPA